MNVVKLLAAFMLVFTSQSSVVADAAEELRRSPVYVAEGVTHQVDEDALEEQIADSGEAIYIALLPSSAGDPQGVLTQLASEVGLRGTYAVVVGNAFRAGGSAAADATAAFQAERQNGVQAVLEDFVDRVSGGGSSESASGNDGESESSGSALPLVALLALGGGGLYLWSRSKRKAASAEEERFEEAERQMLRAELSVLADDVMRLEPEVSLKPEARSDYDAAVARFRAAEAALDYADERVDLVRVARVVAEARYAMDRARARVEGREPPLPPDELRNPGRHDEPPIDVDERREPVYVGHPGGWYGGGGWFGGGGGGLLSGLILGSMLGGGGGLFGGGGHHDHGGDGGGDFGGGDFGGGDF